MLRKLYGMTVDIAVVGRTVAGLAVGTVRRTQGSCSTPENGNSFTHRKNGQKKMYVFLLNQIRKNYAPFSWMLY